MNLYRPARRPFLPPESAAMAIPTSALRIWCVNLTHLHIRTNWSRKFQLWGDGNWVAQWNAKVFHQVLFNKEVNVSCVHTDYTGNTLTRNSLKGAMALVPVKTLTCDGDSYKCTANLVSSPYLMVDFFSWYLTLPVVQVWGDGNWVAQWDTSVFHQSL